MQSTMRCLTLLTATGSHAQAPEAPPPSTNNDRNMSSSFEGLPPELQTIIMHHIPDVATLQNLVSAFPDACAQYIHSPNTILYAVLRDLPSGFAILALKIHDADFGPETRLVAQETLPPGVDFERVMTASAIVPAAWNDRLVAPKPLTTLRRLADTAAETKRLAWWCQGRQEADYSYAPKAWEKEEGGGEWKSPDWVD